MSFVKRWYRKAIACVLLSLVLCVLLYKSFILCGCRFALSRLEAALEGGVLEYESLEWEGSTIVLQGLSLSTPSKQLLVDRVEVVNHLSFGEGCFSPEIRIIHPLLSFSGRDCASSTPVPFLCPSPHFRPRVSISNGVLQFPSARFYFSLLPKEEEESLGSLILSYQPDLTFLPLLKADISYRNWQTRIAFELQETDLRGCFPLTTLLLSSLKDIEEIAGEISMEGEVIFDRSNQLTEATVQLRAHQLLVSGPAHQMRLKCDDMEGSLFYVDSQEENPFGASYMMRGVEWVGPGQWRVQASEGVLTASPEEGMQATLKGQLSQGKLTTSFFASAQGEIFDKMWHPASCHLELGEVLLDLTRSEEGVLEAKIQGDMHTIGPLFWPEIDLLLPQPLPVDLLLTLAREGQLGSCLVAGHLAQDAVEANLSFSLFPLTWAGLLSGNVGVPLLREGACQFPQLDLTHYASLLSFFLPGIEWKGVVRGEAVFSPRGLQMTVQPQSLKIEHEKGSVILDSPLEKEIQISYDHVLHRFSVEAPFSGVSLHPHAIPLALTQASGLLRLTPDSLDIAHFSASCEGMTLQGDIRADFIKEKSVTFTSSKIDASLGQIQQLWTKLDASHPLLPLEGEFVCGPKGLIVTVPWEGEASTPRWTLKGSVTQLTLPMNASTRLQNGRCEIIGDSQSKQLRLEKAEGMWTLVDDTSLSVQVRRFLFDFSQQGALDFSLRLVEGRRECAQIDGRLEHSGSSWELRSDPTTSYIEGVDVCIHNCRWDSRGKLEAFELRPQWKMQEIGPVLQLLKRTGFLPVESDLSFLTAFPLQGHVQARVYSDALSRGVAVAMQSSDVKIKGESYAPFQLQARWSEDVWHIDRMQAGPLTLKGTVGGEGDSISAPYFEGSWKAFAFKGSGYFKSKQQQLHCTLDSVHADLAAWASPSSPLKGSCVVGARFVADFSSPQMQLTGEANVCLDLQAPLALSVSNKKQLRFYYQPGEGLVSEGLDVQVRQRSTGAYLAEVKSARLLYPREGFLSLKDLHLSLTPAFKTCALEGQWLPRGLEPLRWEGALDIQGDLQVTPAGCAFQGALSPGRYGWGERELTLEQVQLSYDKQALHIRAKTFLETHPLWSSLQLDLGKEMYGTLKLFDHPKAEGLTLTLRSQLEGWIVESVQGACYGLSCQLRPQIKRKLLGASSLTGQITCDLSRLSTLLPKTIQKGLSPLKLGSGYTWQGDLVFWHEGNKGFLASGSIQGKEFDILGYRLGSLQAHLEASSEKISVSQLRIEDEAGFLSMKKLDCVKQGEQWSLQIPQIDVGPLQPSLLRKTEGERGSPKPFRIEQFTLTGIRGQMGQLSSFEGSGYLTFANQFKKETSLFDLPLEMIKKVGLDLGLLTPVEGEVQLELRGDKFYLLSLDQAYSEAKRSEFYLAPSKNLSYIDLRGNVHIDLKMRQDVMLKMIEPFTLTVRGTLDKPRYGLQF